MRRLLSILKFVIVPATIGLVIWLSDVREIYPVVVRSALRRRPTSCSPSLPSA